MSDEQPEKRRPPSFVSPQLYIFAAIVVAMWIFVTFFYRNPYQQAVSFDYYDRHPYDEATIWTYVLIIVPLIGLGALLMWVNRRKAGR